MKKNLLIFLPFLFTFSAFAQINLVPNPSFEQYSTCPSSLNQVYLVSPWFNPTQATPDYFNTCFNSGGFYSVDVPANWIGYQNANTGVGYMGVAIYPVQNPQNYREYIEVKLKDSLFAGINYYVSFHVSLADSVNYAADGIGAYFSPDSIFNNNMINLPFNPQVSNVGGNIISDKENWLQIYGQFVAQGGEKFMTVGNFKNDSQTNKAFVSGGGNPDNFLTMVYYYIDDVCVSSSPDTCNIPIGIRSVYFDDGIYLYPNPAKDFIRIKIKGNNLTITLYDARGILKKNILFNENENILNVSDLSEGIYFMQIVTAQKIISRKIIITK